MKCVCERFFCAPSAARHQAQSREKQITLTWQLPINQHRNKNNQAKNQTKKRATPTPPARIGVPRQKRPRSRGNKPCQWGGKPALKSVQKECPTVQSIARTSAPPVTVPMKTSPQAVKNMQIKNSRSLTTDVIQRQ